MQKVKIAVGLLVMLGLGVAVAYASAGNGSPPTGKVGICHHTGKSKAHEWVYIEPDASGVLSGHAKLGHQDFQGPEDIIPAFVLVDSKGVSHSYPGQNLTTRYGADLEPSATGTITGAQLLAGKCTAPAAGGTTTAAVTTIKGSTTVATVPTTRTVTTTATTIIEATTAGTTTVMVTTPGKTHTVTVKKLVRKRVPVLSHRSPRGSLTG